MKVLPFKIPKPEQEALVYKEDHEVYFYDQLHQHEEIQISFIKKGSGSLIVGDSINTYNKNDILVIGGNIPHVFKSDVEAAPESIMYTLFFTKHAFGNNFFQISDMEATKDFFRPAEYGMKISKNHNKIIRVFNKLQNQNKIQRIASLLKIINQIIETEIDLQSKEFQLLECLLRHKGKVVTRSMLLEQVWNYHFDPQTNVIDVHISRLRQKVDKVFNVPVIETVRGTGYRISDMLA